MVKLNKTNVNCKQWSKYLLSKVRVGNECYVFHLVYFTCHIFNNPQWGLFCNEIWYDLCKRRDPFRLLNCKVFVYLIDKWLNRLFHRMFWKFEMELWLVFQSNVKIKKKRNYLCHYWCKNIELQILHTLLVYHISQCVFFLIIIIIICNGRYLLISSPS